MGGNVMSPLPPNGLTSSLTPPSSFPLDQWKQGAEFHYVSNSPWQLYPLIEEFLGIYKFPPGSLHLRMLPGVFQGRYNPIQGKRQAILEIMRDFPHRRFILVGDSGEMDMEMYSAIAEERPGQVLKIFIRDVTKSHLLRRLPSSFLVDPLPDQRSPRSRNVNENSAESPSSSSPSWTSGGGSSWRLGFRSRGRSEEGTIANIRSKLTDFTDRVRRLLEPYDSMLFHDGNDLRDRAHVSHLFQRYHKSRDDNSE